MPMNITLPQTIVVPYSTGEGSWTIDMPSMPNETILGALASGFKRRVQAAANKGLNPAEYVALGEKAIAAMALGWNERTRTTDSVLVEARKVADPIARARLSEDDRKDPAKVRALADKLIARNPAYRHLAEKRLAEAAELATMDDIDLGDNDEAVAA